MVFLYNINLPINYEAPTTTTTMDDNINTQTHIKVPSNVNDNYSVKKKFKALTPENKRFLKSLGFQLRK